MPIDRIRPVMGAITVLLSASLLAGCGAGSDTARGRVRVAASFYPLAFLAEQIGGDRVSVTGLTKPGAEPHDLELGPSDVADVARADLVIYLSKFQPAVDDAVKEADASHVFDVGPTADLSHTFTPIEEGAAKTGEAGVVDPHFWLDPHRFAAVAAAVGERLATADPTHAAEYRTRAAALVTRLGALDAEFRDGLASCRQKNLVTSHNAFGYLAERYGLRQLGITGLTPESEPSPAQLADVSEFVERNEVTTIYFETLVSPAIAKVVAGETGASTAVLDPIEGLTKDSAGDDYLAVMRSNLRTLRRGQDCP